MFKVSILHPTDFVNSQHRNSHQRCSIKTGALKHFAKFTSLRPATLLKYRLWQRRFSVNFAKFLKTPFLTEHLRWLLLTTDLSMSEFKEPVIPCSLNHYIYAYKICKNVTGFNMLSEICPMQSLLSTYVSHAGNFP